MDSKDLTDRAALIQKVAEACIEKNRLYSSVVSEDVILGNRSDSLTIVTSRIQEQVDAAVTLWLPLNIGVASYLNKNKLLSPVHKTQKITHLSVQLKKSDSHFSAIL